MRRLERLLGRVAIPQLTLWIIAGQVCAYIALHVPMRGLDQATMLSRLMLSPEHVWAGEWWRLASFIFLPPFCMPIFDVFTWWLLYLMGTSLEATWGTFRYNLYVWLWWLATVTTTLLIGLAPMTNYGLQQGVFLAFAWLFPEFVLNIYFVLPIPIRYLAWLRWAFILWTALQGPPVVALLLLASVANFLIFFGREVWVGARGNARRMRREVAQHRGSATAARHRCSICGVTDQDAPGQEFRYCSRCAGQPCYCGDHLRNHEHITGVADSTVPTSPPA